MFGCAKDLDFASVENCIYDIQNGQSTAETSVVCLEELGKAKKRRAFRRKGSYFSTTENQSNLTNVLPAGMIYLTDMTEEWKGLEYLILQEPNTRVRE
jgi:hypothetical protein